MTIKPVHRKWLESRGIDMEIAVRYGLYTEGDALAFPYQEGDGDVAVKFRGPDKRFWKREGGKSTFWNVNVLDDPALRSGDPLVITEGEIDALTAIQCGFPLTVSVPDGAPARMSDGEPGRDENGKFAFMANNRQALRNIHRFILAVDNDGPGQVLAQELVRRLSPARCSFVHYPEGCKDLNDVLQSHMEHGVQDVLQTAKPYPVRGLYRLSQYPDCPPLQTFSTGWDTLDGLFRPWPGEFVVVTGIPGHGKSTWALNLMANLSEIHGWRHAVFSPEMPAKPQMRDKLRRIRLRCALDMAPLNDIVDADAWIEDAFVFIDSDPGETDTEDELSLEWVLDKATDAVYRYGVQTLLIDPWNEIEHARNRDETVTDYIGRSIRAMKRFARTHGVVVIVVAHPTKEVGRDGKGRAVTLFDVEGSAHWFNKPDHGLVIDRPDPQELVSIVRVAKCRFEESGRKGEVRMRFVEGSGRFEYADHVEPAGDVSR